MKKFFACELMHLFQIPITILIIGILVMTPGCKKEKTDYSIQDLLGTWEFVAFRASDGSLKTVQKYDSYPEDCYTLTFYADTTMTGRSVFNLLTKKFLLSGNHLSFPWGVLATEFGEIGEPKTFTEALRDVSSFKIEDTQLKLFYPGHRFLLFNFRTN